MAEISYRGASRIYSGTRSVRAVDRLDLDIADGEFLVLVGPSGSGKSTALRMLAGLEDVDEGHILIGGRDVSRASPKQRDIAMVFQSYALYPHMTVAGNMGFALRLAKWSKQDIRDRVREVAELLDLSAYLDRKPKALSGGQRQRVAMGRAIVRDPAAFLMDEPLSNLDAKLRVETRANIASLQKRLGATTVYVTHDQTEAMTMGHRVAVLKDGLLQQCDTPRALYERPANVFVAGFIGSPGMNIATLPVTGDGARIGNLTFPMLRSQLDGVERGGGEARVTVGVRPEALQITSDAADGLPMDVELVEELGADSFVYGAVAVDGGPTERFAVRTGGRATPRIGDRVHVSLRDASSVHAFRAETGERLE